MPSTNFEIPFALRICVSLPPIMSLILMTWVLARCRIWTCLMIDWVHLEADQHKHYNMDSLPKVQVRKIGVPAAGPPCYMYTFPSHTTTVEAARRR